MREHIHSGNPHVIVHGWPWLLALIFLLAAGPARADPVFKCVDAHGAIAFQAAPCTGGARQTAVEVHEQPLIDPHAPRSAPHASPKPSVVRARARDGRQTTSHRARKSEQAVSYECRAADGEVFYRHGHCPGSVRGDGIARFGADQARASSHGGSRNTRGAWNEVRVISHKISRSEACRQINATAAAGRDGSIRDEQVSVYEHDLGRDPCRGY